MCNNRIDETSIASIFIKNVEEKTFSVITLYDFIPPFLEMVEVNGIEPVGCADL